MDNTDGILCSFNEFLDHLKKHMNDLHSEVTLNDRLYSEEDYPKLKALVVESASIMERNISKLHLIFSSMTVDALISLLKDTETVFVNVVESARLFMCCGLTNAARNEIATGVDTIYSAIENLVDHCKTCYKEKRSKLSPSMTGAVWDACKQLNSISDSNKKACLKESLRNVCIIHDILKECKEALKEEEEDDDDECDDDWDDLLEDLQAFHGSKVDEGEIIAEDRSKEIKEAITNQVELIQHSLETLYRVYSKELPAVIPMKMIDSLNKVSSLEHAISDDCNYLGMMLYTVEPTDEKNMKKTITDLQELVKVVPNVITKQDVLTSFTKQVQDVIMGLESLVKQL